MDNHEKYNPQKQGGFLIHLMYRRHLAGNDRAGCLPHACVGMLNAPPAISTGGTAKRSLGVS